jgi:hypothetical protein
MNRDCAYTGLAPRLEGPTRIPRFPGISVDRITTLPPGAHRAYDARCASLSSLGSVIAPRDQPESDMVDAFSSPKSHRS